MSETSYENVSGLKNYTLGQEDAFIKALWLRGYRRGTLKYQDSE